MLAYQPSAPACGMMETTGYYGNDAMDTQGSSSINSVEFGESCLYAAAAAAASIVHQPPPPPPPPVYQQQPHPNHLHQQQPPHHLPPFEPLNSASLLDGPCGPPAPPTPPPYVGAPPAFMQQQDLSAMEVKVEPDTLMDDYSPVSSYLGSTSPSSQSSPLGNNPGRLRKQKEDKTCGVCGDKALGYNFDAISCESCKAFFRRNAPKGLDYFKCPYDEKCKMDVSNRRFCKRCRLKKCFEIGMRKEYILTDEEKARKRQKIEENKYAATTKPPQCVTVDTPEARLMKDLERQGLVPHRSEVSSQTRMMSEQDQADIEEVLTAYQASLDINMENDFPREQANSMSDLVNIAELSVRRVIAMAKQMKDFRILPQTDQIALLKGGSIELLILRSVVSFDKEKQQFLDCNDTEAHKALKLEQFKKAENGTGLFEEHMKFVKTLAVDIGADQTTLLLLLVISLYSPDRDNLKDKDHVSAQQERYSMLLQNYLDVVYSYPMARIMLPRLLMKLTDIRNLNEEHSQVLLKVNPEGIQPLMKEVLDITQ